MATVNTTAVDAVSALASRPSSALGSPGTTRAKSVAAAKKTKEAAPTTDDATSSRPSTEPRRTLPAARPPTSQTAAVAKAARVKTTESLGWWKVTVRSVVA